MFIAQLPLGFSLIKSLPLRAPISNYHKSNEVTMTRPRLAIRSYPGLLLAGAILFQMTLLPAQPIPIAVVEFEGNGISQTEAIALTDRLRNELFRLGAFEVVERGMMETILTEQDFQLTGCTSNECLVEVGQLLGARQVVGGRISRVGAMFTVSARVVDVQTGKLLGVSDFDLRGGLEEMLTRGMKQVAVMLSGGEAADLPVASVSQATAATPAEKRPGVLDLVKRQLLQPRTWSINAGFGTSRNFNFLEITKDVIVWRNLSLFVSAGIGLRIYLGGGITYQSHYNEKGLVLSTSVGIPPFPEDYIVTNASIAYQWPLGRRGFLVTGAGLIIFLDYGDAFPYPVLSYEFRF